MTNLKTSFIISILFHGVMLLSVASFYQPTKEGLMDITPLEFIHLPEEEGPQEIVLPEKVEVHPSPLKTEEKKEEMKPVEEIKPAPPLQEVKTDTTKPVEDQVEPILSTKEMVEVPPPPAISSPVTAIEPEIAPFAQGGDDAGGIPVIAQEGSDSETALSGGENASQGSRYGVEGGMGFGTGDEIRLFKAMVRTKIEQTKFYPQWVRQRGFEGTVGVRFVIQSDGSVNDVKVVRPCHCEILNRAACEAITKAAPFNPRPGELEGKEMVMEIDISFKLER